MRRARVRHFVYMEIIRGCQMETITSRENAKIKYACRLREEEKLRTADGLFFAEGPKLCLELARGCTLQTLYATEKALAHTPELEAFAGKTVLVTEPVAQKLSGTKTSQDVFGVFEHPGWQAADILAKGRRILALEAVQDGKDLLGDLRTGVRADAAAADLARGAANHDDLTGMQLCFFNQFFCGLFGLPADILKHGWVLLSYGPQDACGRAA